MRAVPSHIAIIPDGNRRFAIRLMENPSKGHEWGVDKLKKLFDWCKELGIKTVTFYSLSLENIDKRPKEELDFIFSLTKKEINDILSDKDNFIHKNKIKMSFFGKLEILPEEIQEKIKQAEDATSHYVDFRINFAMAYGGRQELIDASRRIGKAVSSGQLNPEDINEEVIRQNLLTNGNPDPDLVIRTGKEKRLSNFLIFQSAYSELFFSESFWPEFNKEEFTKIIHEFMSRDRRFGK